MVIPDQIRKCVVFLACPTTSEPRLAGTAFLVGRPTSVPGRTFAYLVTARHVVRSIRARSNDVLIRYNTVSGGAVWGSMEVSSWYEHPTDDSVDVAVAPIRLPPDADHLLLPEDTFISEQKITEHEIGLGEEVFMAGLFVHHAGRDRNTPIVRVGNIAALPEERVESAIGAIEAYLVESRSIGGLSGSPTFVNLGTVRLIQNQMRHATKGPMFFLLGLMHGHWDVGLSDLDHADQDAPSFEPVKRVNMGIAMVVPARQISEVIAHPTMRAQEDESNRQLVLSAGADPLTPAPPSAE